MVVNKKNNVALPPPCIKTRMAISSTTTITTNRQQRRFFSNNKYNNKKEEEEEANTSSFDDYINSHYVPRGPVHFEDFLAADTNRDGRVTAQEWEAYLKKLNYGGESADETQSLMIHVPLSPIEAYKIISTPGFGITLNGLHYGLQVFPKGRTLDIIKKKEAQLDALEKELALLENIKLPLDAQAAKHTKRVMTSLLTYLIVQAGVLVKYTFFDSEFGWDVTEPFTYFLTFSISLAGLVFFTYNRIEFSYPALAASVAHRKAKKLYVLHKFDIDKYLELQKTKLTIKRELDVLIPPKIQ